MTYALEFALKCYQHGRFDAALGYLECTLSQNPRQVAALELKGIIQRGEGNFRPALDTLEAAEDIRPLSCVARLALADCYCVFGYLDLARSHYRGLANQRNVPSNILSGLAAGLSRVGDMEQALEVCREALAREPDSHQALYGTVYYMSKTRHEPADVLPLARRLVDWAPEIFLYRVAVVTLLEQLERFREGYLVIADATPSELASLDCTCCLSRLMRLYEEFGDHRRAGVCHKRLSAGAFGGEHP